MRRSAWINGRLAWPLVIVVAYLSMLILLFDFFQRVLVMPFFALVFYEVTFGLAGALLIAGLVLLHRKVRGTKPA